MGNIPPANGSYQVFPQFTGHDNACTNAVYLLPPTYDYPQATTFSLSNLYIGTGSLPQGTSNTDFAVSLSKAGSAVTVDITLAGQNMWNCAAARATLMANFTAFLLWIETNLELTQQLVPGSTVMIAQQIAANLPAPLVETLFYTYGLVTGLAAETLPIVDIRPGMRLRIDTEVSQFVTPNSNFNGYVGAGSFSYDIGSIPPVPGSTQLTRLIAFDPFLGTIATPKIQNPSPIVAGSVIDLEPVGGAQSYWRLFYPENMVPPGTAGQSGIGNNVALIGAASLNALNTATVSYPDGCISTTTCAYFLGRTIAVPQIQIFVSVANLFTVDWVPLGTTFRNVIERYMTILPGTSVGNLTRRGAQGNVDFGPSSGAIDPRVYDLPLIGGDIVTPSLT